MDSYKNRATEKIETIKRIFNSLFFINPTEILCSHQNTLIQEKIKTEFLSPGEEENTLQVGSGGKKSHNLCIFRVFYLNQSL